MNVVIQELRRDHHNFQRVLKLIRHLVNARADSIWPQEGADQNERTLEKAFDYMESYVRKVHHQKEDLVFDVYASHKPLAGNYLEQMRSEHDSLNNQVDEIRSLVTRTAFSLATGKKPAAHIKQKMIKYFDAQIGHMQFEEISIYPPVETALTIDDWKMIIKSAPKTSDPAFGADRLPEFKPLSDGVADLEELRSVSGWTV